MIEQLMLNAQCQINRVMLICAMSGSLPGNAQVYDFQHAQNVLLVRCISLIQKTGCMTLLWKLVSTNQLWKWSESGTQLYNMATEAFVSVQQLYEWTTVAKEMFSC